MELLKLLGVVIVIVGFLIRFDTIATVVIAGLVTGFIAGMTPADILDVLGKAFITNRTATLFVLTLPVIGVLERYGLKDKAVDLIRKMKGATAGVVLTVYLGIRTVASAFSVRLGGHPQFVRPLVQPMANGAAVARYGELKDKTVDKIKGHSAANENYGNFFAQNCFMGAAGTLLIVTTLNTQHYAIDALHVAVMSIPVAVVAFVVGTVQNFLVDRKLKREYTTVGTLA